MCSIAQTKELSSPTVFYDVSEYNKEYIVRANSFLIEKKPQSGDTCVCHSIVNMTMALTKSKLKYSDFEKRYEGGCDDVNFIDAYSSLSERYAGQFFGSTAMFYGMSPVSSDVAIEKAIAAIDEGKVVSISLNAAPMYKEYAAKFHTTFRTSKFSINESVLGRLSHAIVLIGVQRNVNGVVTEFIVADSSGPQRKYLVSANALRNSYSSISTLLSRGIYIPNQSIYPPIHYSPH